MLYTGRKQPLCHGAHRLPRAVGAVEVHARVAVGAERGDRVADLGEPLAVGERVDGDRQIAVGRHVAQRVGLENDDRIMLAEARVKPLIHAW
jgi:hypothetical protein